MTDIIPANEYQALDRADRMIIAGQAANQAAQGAVFADYRSRKAPNTLRRQDNDLAIFARFLAQVHLSPGDLANDSQAWQGITWGIVAAFIQWQLRAGYAVSSVNMRLSTVKVYAGLAALAGVIPAGELAMIRQVKSYKRTEQVRLDDNRAAAGVPTRTGYKKALPVSLSKKQAAALLIQPDTPQGRRDRLMVALLIGLGLRVGELAGLTVDNFTLTDGTVIFYRPKVDKIQTHKLDPISLAALRAYIDSGDAPETGSIWRQSLKGRGLDSCGLSTRAICKRIRYLGERIGIKGLSPHDLRHYWATQAARHNTPLDRLQDAGGWASLAMPGRYVEAAKIANDGVRREE